MTTNTIAIKRLWVICFWQIALFTGLLLWFALVVGALVWFVVGLKTGWSYAGRGPAVNEARLTESIRRPKTAAVQAPCIKCRG